MKLGKMGFKKLRSVVYYQDNQVMVSYDEKHMERIIETYGADCIQIYNPTEEVRKEILQLLEGGRKGFEKVELSNIALLKSISLLTDIEFGDLTEEEAHEIVCNPNEMLEVVNSEISIIHISLLREQFTIAQSLASMPEAVKRPMVEKMLENTLTKEEIEKMKELEKLEEEMKLLEQKKKALKGE